MRHDQLEKDIKFLYEIRKEKLERASGLRKCLESASPWTPDYARLNIHHEIAKRDAEKIDIIIANYRALYDSIQATVKEEKLYMEGLIRGYQELAYK